MKFIVVHNVESLDKNDQPQPAYINVSMIRYVLVDLGCAYIQLDCRGFFVSESFFEVIKLIKNAQQS